MQQILNRQKLSSQSGKSRFCISEIKIPILVPFFNYLNSQPVYTNADGYYAATKQVFTVGIKDLLFTSSYNYQIWYIKSINCIKG